MKRCLAFFLFSFTSLFADETINEITAKDGQSYNYLSEFVNMLLTLGFVLILIFASVWFLKKIMRSRMRTMNHSNGIRILERRPINTKSSLYLVDILGKGIVICESQSGVHMITEFPDSVNVEELLENIREENKNTSSLKETFAGKLRRVISKNAG